MLQDSAAAIQFVDKLIEEKGLQGLDEEIRLQLRTDLLRRLEDRINRAIVASLNTHQLAQFEHLIDTNKIDSLQDFLYKQGINVNGVIASAMSEFHASYLEA
jgi:uncharacterized protein DUF5663